MNPGRKERLHSARGLSPDSPDLPAEPVSATARLASIVESSDDAIIGKDLSGVIVSWNRGATAVYGYTAEEAIGQSINLLVPPEQYDEEQDILARIRAGQRMHQFQTIRLKKGGIRINVALAVSPVWEQGRIVGASHVAREISERRRLEAATARLAAIVESSEDAIVSKTLEGTIETWNSGAVHIYGYSEAEAVGRNISFLLPRHRIQEEQGIMAMLARGERVQHFETTRMRKDGTLIDVSLTISPIRDSSGTIVGASHIARDITGRKRLEQQMHQAQRLESLGVLAGGIAHDFNNLLTGILGNASLIADGLPGHHPLQEYLTGVIGAAQNAAGLTSQLLAYSGRGRFVIGPVDLSALIAEIHVLIRASVPKNVVVHLDLDPGLPFVEADQNQMKQLIMNLIINGAEAIGENRPGTVVVRSHVQHLEQTYIRTILSDTELSAGEFVCVEVRDDGCGMDEETQARIFDPFFTTKFLGRGLGLAAALGIVKSHKGVIRVYSTPGHGTTFKVFLPALSRRAPSPEVASDSSRGTILVVDDEDFVRKVAKSTLEKQGYSIVLAANGREAVESLHNSPSIDLVLLDLTMPVMGGEEALRQIRTIRPTLPVILSSGYNEAEAMRHFEHEIIAAFVQKPYTSTTLREKVENVLRAAKGSG